MYNYADVDRYYAGTIVYEPATEKYFQVASIHEFDGTVNGLEEVDIRYKDISSSKRTDYTKKNVVEITIPSGYYNIISGKQTLYLFYGLKPNRKYSKSFNPVNILVNYETFPFKERVLFRSSYGDILEPVYYSPEESFNAIHTYKTAAQAINLNYCMAASDEGDYIALKYKGICEIGKMLGPDVVLLHNKSVPLNNCLHTKLLNGVIKCAT